MRARFWIPLPFLALACGSDAKDPTPAAPSVYVAFAEDFQNFRAWSSFDPGPGIPGNSHLTGPRRVYVKQAPPAGASEWPVGTLIVKESGDDPDVANRIVFAMVKRGGDFDPTGAVDWEWFSLTNVDASNVTISWRGFGPATGAAYGTPQTGGCNACHAAALETDFVFTPPVYLTAAK